MKLAITTQGSEVNALVDLRFGRARFFRIVDTETGQQTTVDNAEGVNAVQGAGTHAAQTLARLGVQVVLTGHVGPKALSALQAAKIQVYSVSGGTAEQAVQDYLAGRLRALAQADVRGHWR
jgi:predicted Fe-Mo cluster-binding NifX family protein